MPFPLLFIPIISAAAATTTTSTATIVSVAAGGVALGTASGVVSYWLWFSKSISELSQEHKTSLDAQKLLTQQRIESANKEVEAIAPQLTIVAIEVQAAASATTASVSELQQSTEQLLLIGCRLKEEMAAMKEVSASLVATHSTLKVLSEQAHEEVRQSTEKLSELTGLLQQKEGEIKQVRGDIDVLNTTVQEQTEVIVHLEEAVKTTIIENDTLKQKITQKDFVIDTLEPQVKRLTDQNRFFKAAALQGMPQSLQNVGEFKLVSSIVTKT